MRLKKIIKEYFTEYVQALQSGCLLHVCCQVKAICCRIGKLKKYFRVKVAYVPHFIAYV